MTHGWPLAKWVNTEHAEQTIVNMNEQYSLYWRKNGVLETVPWAQTNCTFVRKDRRRLPTNNCLPLSGDDIFSSVSKGYYHFIALVTAHCHWHTVRLHWKRYTWRVNDEFCMAAHMFCPTQWLINRWRAIRAPASKALKNGWFFWCTLTLSFTVCYCCVCCCSFPALSDDYTLIALSLHWLLHLNDGSFDSW